MTAYGSILMNKGFGFKQNYLTFWALCICRESQFPHNPIHDIGSQKHKILERKLRI